MIRSFEIGKCYEHTTGKRIYICGWLVTHAWGKAMVGEDARGSLIPIGDTEEATVNWSEITEKAFQKGPTQTYTGHIER